MTDKWTRFTKEPDPIAEELMKAADEGRIDWDAPGDEVVFRDKPDLAAARLGDGPVVGPLTPKQVRILDNRHHRTKDSHLCACGQVWAHCEVHRLIETIPAFRSPAPALDVERLRDAINLTAIPTLLVFADENAGVREAIAALRAALAEPES